MIDDGEFDEDRFNNDFDDVDAQDCPWQADLENVRSGVRTNDKKPQRRQLTTYEALLLELQADVCCREDRANPFS